ncbi:MAG TPA: hypothetical protein ENK91_12655 [Bacteroidetes bacterium]|nr:hypothetical protein [Bacteroidota bacterium]
MTKIFFTIILFLLVESVFAQKVFSFFDGVEASASVGYNFGYGIDRTERNVKIFIFGSPQYKEVLQPSILTSNFASYSFATKYYIQAYKNLKVGVGFVYTMSRLKLDYFGTPRSRAANEVIHIGRYDRFFRLHGPSVSIRYLFPKLKVKVTISKHILFGKQEYRNNITFDRGFLYENDNTSILDFYRFENLPIPKKNLLFSTPLGIRVDYAVLKNINLSFGFMRVGGSGSVRIQHAYSQSINGVSEEANDEVAVIYIPGNRISIGLTYYFSNKRKKSNVANKQ